MSKRESLKWTLLLHASCSYALNRLICVSHLGLCGIYDRCVSPKSYFKSSMEKQILVVGAGVCGIGACSRLTQLGHTNWTMVDKSDLSGGLASSFEQDGFFWDLGGHITFSHYQFYTDVADQGLQAFANNNTRFDFGDDLWLKHRRRVFVRYDRDSWVPYPFQNNFFYCKNDKLIEECFDGLIDINQTAGSNSIAGYQNFQELVNGFFGKGLAKHFMNPYNFKVWGYPLEQMSVQWVGDRVAKTDLRSNLRKYIQYRQASLSEDNNVGDSGWGPNAYFRYPKYGGIGAIWEGAISLLDQEKIKLNTHVAEIDIEQQIVKFFNSPSVKYDHLINTMPLDILINKIIKPTKLIDLEEISKNFEPMKYSTTHVIGLGIESKNQPEDLKDKYWLYFPSERSPFYRCMLQSKLSPYTAPKPNDQWSLQLEICETPHRPVSKDQDSVVEEAIQGAINEGLITKEDAENNIISKFYKKLDYG